MQDFELSIINNLNQVIKNIVNTENLSDEMLSQLLGIAPKLSDWLQSATDEAVTRARNGVEFYGYSLKESTRRRIIDEEGALSAIQDYYPAIAPMCQKTHLVGICEIESLIGKIQTQAIIGPYIGHYSWFNLVRNRD